MSRETPQPVVAHQVAKFSCCGQYFMSGPANQCLSSVTPLPSGSIDWSRGSFVFWKISRNRVVKYWSGVMKILMSLLNIFFRPGASSSKGIVGIGYCGLFIGVRSGGNPPSESCQRGLGLASFARRTISCVEALVSCFVCSSAAFARRTISCAEDMV